MFIRTKCETPFSKKSIKLYWAEIRQITKGRKSGKYVRYTPVAATDA
jgi:hypothetical protein